MKRHHLAAIASITLGLSVTLAASDASAQTPNQPPPNAPPTGPLPPTVAATAGGAPITPGAVRLHVSTEKNRGVARLYVHQPDGKYTLVCSTPCTADVPVNSEMRVTLNNNDEEPHTFTVPGDMGPELDIEVKPASVGPLIGGIIAMAAGGAFALSGLFLVAIASTDSGSSSKSTSSLTESVKDTYRVTGYICIGIGAAAAIVGLVVLTSRSKEPRLNAGPRSAPFVQGRADMLLGDLATATPREATRLPPAIMPLSYTIKF